MNKKIYIYGIFLLVMLQLVTAIGVNYPLPDLIQIAPGQSERFEVGLQTPASSPVGCTFEITESAGFGIEFDEPEIQVLEGKKKALGTITAPDNAVNGKNTIKFCVVCSAISEQKGAGSGMEFKNCGIPINVEIVGERNRENLPEIPKEPSKLPTTPLIVIIIIIIIIAIILWYRHEKRNNPELNKPRTL